jgi:signal transduction histidine kinase
VNDKGNTASTIGLWIWDVLFAASTALTVVLIVVQGGEPEWLPVPAAALVVAFLVGWLVLGRRLALTAYDRGLVRYGYCVALGVGLVIATLFNSQAGWAAFVVYSQMFWLLPLTAALVSVVAVAVIGPIAGTLVHDYQLFGVDFPVQALFMTMFGVLVGIFIHRLSDESERRAELIAELEASQAEVGELSHRAGVAAERERLAGEIHDTLAQGFTSIVTLLQAAQAQFDGDPTAARRHLDLAVRAARENLREARQLVAASAPSDLASRSLADAVGRQVDRWTEETAVSASCEVTGTPRQLPPEEEIVLLRAAQELLANVARHAGASAVAVRLDYTDPSTVTLSVTDDGTGFDAATVGEGSFGLRLMRGRVERLAGTVAVDSGSSGSTVTVTL